MRTMRNFCAIYERAFAELFKAEGAFAFWKGRVALYAILKALGIDSGDEVILPGYTCMVNANPIKYLGAKPVYVDIEPRTFNIDVAQLESKITVRTKAIIAQHTYGYPCDIDSMLEVAILRGIPLIEDCCLALGSKYKGKTAGTFGKAAYFSFQWNKAFTTGLGGVAITNDAKLAERLSVLRAEQMCEPSRKEALMLAAQLTIYRLSIYPRTTALAQNIFRYLTKKDLILGSYSIREYEPIMAEDFFKDMSWVQARSGLRQLRKLQQNIAHRKKIAEFYDQLLAERGWKGREFDSSIMGPVMVRYPIRIKEKKQALEEAAGAGVELGSWFECPLHPIETPLEVYDYKPGMCPEAEKAARETVNLPVHPRVSEKTAAKTVNFITRFTQAQ